MLMKKTVLIVICSSAFLGQAMAQGSLQGDEKLACEALLCLSASTRPAECTPSLQRYFSISFKKFSDTLRGRMNFLNMCPMVTDASMATYKSAVINGSGRCDAASINQSSYVSDAEGTGYVNNAMPDYCQTYYGAQYMQSAPPLYIGTPTQGGYWVEPKDYEISLKAYNAMMSSRTQPNMPD
jgi:hypothetical protein